MQEKGWGPTAACGGGGGGLRRHGTERVTCILTCPSTWGTTLGIAPQKRCPPHLLRQHVSVAWSSPNWTGWLAGEPEGPTFCFLSTRLKIKPNHTQLSLYVGPRYRTQVLVLAQVFCPLSYGRSSHQSPSDVMGLAHLTETNGFNAFHVRAFQFPLSCWELFPVTTGFMASDQLFLVCKEAPQSTEIPLDYLLSHTHPPSLQPVLFFGMIWVWISNWKESGRISHTEEPWSLDFYCLFFLPQMKLYKY